MSTFSACSLEKMGWRALPEPPFGHSICQQHSLGPLCEERGLGEHGEHTVKRDAAAKFRVTGFHWDPAWPEQEGETMRMMT